MLRRVKMAVVLLGVASLTRPLPASAAVIEMQDTLLTFAKDVAPIMYKNCGMCHRPGGIGPFSVFDFDSVRARTRKIRAAVSSGHMPPWFSDSPRGTFANDRRLSEVDKSTVLRWIAGGANLGDPAMLPPQPVYASGWEIGTPDAVFAMPEDYTVPAQGTVEYQYFQVPTNFATDKWVQSIEILPGAREVVHHVLVFVRAPKTKADASKGGSVAAPTPAKAKPVLVFDETQDLPDVPRADSHNPPPEELGSLIGTTAPGTNVLRLPEGAALLIRAGSVLTFQMHYTAHGHEMKDRTSIGFRFATKPPSERVYASQFINTKFVLPAGAADVMVPSTLGFNEAVRVHGIFPHTHVRGTRWQYLLEKPDGSSEVILNVPEYDFNWQTYYLFAHPLEIAAGSRIVARAWYDNSANNPDNPNPAVAVRWGDQTWEEMQYTGILFSVTGRRPGPVAGRGSR